MTSLLAGFDHEKEKTLPLTFTANAASTIAIEFHEDNPVAMPFDISGLHYRLGTTGDWIKYSRGQVFELAPGKKLQFWNNSTRFSRDTIEVVDPATGDCFYYSYYATFVMTGSVTGGGNLTALTNFQPPAGANPFMALFFGCAALTRTPRIPLLDYRLIDDCTGLKEVVIDALGSCYPLSGVPEKLICYKPADLDVFGILPDSWTFVNF